MMATKTTNSFFFVDSFSVGLDDLPRKKQADNFAVLRLMTGRGRFSCFEASANDTIAGTITRVMRSGWVESYVPAAYKGQMEPGGTRSPDRDTYPWTYVRLTDAGRAALRLAQGDSNV